MTCIEISLESLVALTFKSFFVIFVTMADNKDWNVLLKNGVNSELHSIKIRGNMNDSKIDWDNSLTLKIRYNT